MTRLQYLIATWTVALAGAAIVLAMLLLTPASAQESLPILKFRAIDGDTVDYGGKHYRLKRYNTPESYGAQCRAEKMLGILAKKRLQTLLNSQGIVSFSVDPKPDKYGRGLMDLTLNGQHISTYMVPDFAEAYDCPNNRCPRRADWCAKQ